MRDGGWGAVALGLLWLATALTSLGLPARISVADGGGTGSYPAEALRRRGLEGWWVGGVGFFVGGRPQDQRRAGLGASDT